MDQYLKLWPTPVAIFNHPDYEAINAEILAHDELRDIRGLSLGKGSNKQNLWDRMDSIPVLKELNKWMLDCTAKYAADCFGLEYRPDYFYHEYGAINRRGRGDESVIHSHRLTTVVMTYYVDVHEGCGDIRLLDPRGTLGWISIADEHKQHNQFNHSPKNGQMIMFPGWVMHSVVHNKTDRERIAVTSNVSLKPEYKNLVQ